ncbi:hypothetical protein AB0I28_16020 [Phytomonospora sp. NPDC050363]|uniref:hypothetical protein n=1 Tax=Phytomonospora sp. NPDC050363 TaxID=3155642 RepID=UPI0033DB34F3
MILWGWRTTVRHLATVVYMCSQTGQQAGYAVLKRVTKFTLFFIPLFPLSVKYTLECSLCGESRKISREDADQAVASQGHNQQHHHSQGGHPTPPPQQQPYPAPQQIPGQYPQQQAQPQQYH